MIVGKVERVLGEGSGMRMGPAEEILERGVCTVAPAVPPVGEQSIAGPREFATRTTCADPEEGGT